MKKLFLLSSLLLFCFISKAQNIPIYLDRGMPIEKRIDDAVSRMTLEEKVAMVHAQSKFSSAGVPRLGIPENWMSDGPHGIRAEVLWDEWNGANWTNDSCTSFPALSCLAASWNTAMSYLYGKSVGEEARYRNKTVLLGPDVSICRVPLNGRNFEYMSEDPYLSGAMAVPYIQALQSNGVAACVKHFALNNQETNRDHINVVVDGRTLNEIYMPAFKMCVQQGHTWAVMLSYNKYKGQHLCQNRALLLDKLKKEWGFDGVAISDWGGVHNTEEAAINGLDMEFGSWTNGQNWGASNAYDNYYLAQPYLALLKSGKLSIDDLNDKVRRIMRLEFRTNMNPERPYGSFATEEHLQAGRKIADEGIVLLKNRDNVLPLKRNIHNLLIVGENAVKRMTIGGGSSSLKVKKEYSPLEGIKMRAAKDGIKVTYVSGYVSPAVAAQDVKAATAAIQGVINEDSLRSEAAMAAKEADAVIFIGGLNKNEFQDCEGADRQSLQLPYHQDKLISALTNANKNTIVVLVSGTPVEMPWMKSVPSIVEAWYGGSAAGLALADILFGDVNPSGKLPVTFYANLKQCGAIAMGEYPGNGTDVTYKDGMYVGYRYIDKNNIKPLFPFGFGLSYTTFKYGDVSYTTSADSITFNIKVTNTGKRRGSEVVQLYVSDTKPLLDGPVKALKGFEKLDLEAGETKTATITIAKDAMQYWDNGWKLNKGTYEAMIGASSKDIKSRVKFNM